MGFLLALQLIRCIYTNLYPIFDNSDLKMTEYQTYMLTSFLLMIAAMYYFLYIAIHKKRAMYIVAFNILVSIFNVYMIFRDVVFMNWPQYYFTEQIITPGNVKESLASWRYVAAFSIMVSLFSSFLYYLLTGPTI